MRGSDHDGGFRRPLVRGRLRSGLPQAALPRLARGAAPGGPAGQQVADLAQGRIEADRTSHADQHGLIEVDLVPVKELPAVVVGVVTDEHDRRAIEHGSDGDGRRIGRLIEGPVLFVGQCASAPGVRTSRTPSVRLAVLRLGALHDGNRLGDPTCTILVSGALEVLVGDVVLAHLEVGIHASAGQGTSRHPSSIASTICEDSNRAATFRISAVTGRRCLADRLQTMPPAVEDAAGDLE